MRELEDNSVTLTVTSPPYHDVVAYDLYAQGRKAEAKSVPYRKLYGAYDGYLSLMTRVFCEVFRVTRPGGFLALNVSPILRDGTLYHIPADLVARLTDQGWIIQDDITWHKGRSTSDRAGSFVQHPSPGYFYANVMTEHVLIFRKPGPKLYEGKSREDLESSRVPLSSLMTRDIVNNCWCIAPVKGGSLAHPAPFPEELPHRLILLYSYPGDLVLDCFAGSGTTLKVARALDRQAVGYELEEAFAKYAQSRVNEPLTLRRSQALLRVEPVLDDPFVQIGQQPTGECPPPVGPKSDPDGPA